MPYAQRTGPQTLCAAAVGWWCRRRPPRREGSHARSAIVGVGTGEPWKPTGPVRRTRIGAPALPTGASSSPTITEGHARGPASTLQHACPSAARAPLERRPDGRRCGSCGAWAGHRATHAPLDQSWQGTSIARGASRTMAHTLRAALGVAVGSARARLGRLWGGAGDGARATPEDRCAPLERRWNASRDGRPPGGRTRS